MTDAYAELYARGKTTREATLDSSYIKSRNQLSRHFGGDIEGTVTALVWGGIWSRPGLSLRDRSVVTVAVLAALGRLDALEQQLKGAIRNGCTAEELQEVILQVGAYAGFPAAMTASQIARGIFSTQVENVDPD